MYDKKEVGKRLIDIRKEKGVKREDVAEAIGYSEEAVKSAEQGKSISLNMVTAMACYYGKSLDYIMFGTEMGELDSLCEKLPVDKKGLVYVMIKGMLDSLKSITG